MLKLSYNCVHSQYKGLGCNNVSQMPGNTNGYYLEVNEATALKGQPSRLDQCIMWCYKHDFCCHSVWDRPVLIRNRKTNKYLLIQNLFWGKKNPLLFKCLFLSSSNRSGDQTYRMWLILHTLPHLHKGEFQRA